MGISISDARDMTLWEYEAALTQYNARSDPDADLDVVTADDWRRTQDFFARNPQLMN